MKPYNRHTEILVETDFLCSIQCISMFLFVFVCLAQYPPCELDATGFPLCCHMQHQKLHWFSSSHSEVPIYAFRTEMTVKSTVAHNNEIFSPGSKQAGRTCMSTSVQYIGWRARVCACIREIKTEEGKCQRQRQRWPWKSKGPLIFLNDTFVMIHLR